MLGGVLIPNGLGFGGFEWRSGSLGLKLSGKVTFGPARGSPFDCEAGHTTEGDDKMGGDGASKGSDESGMPVSRLRKWKCQISSAISHSHVGNHGTDGWAKTGWEQAQGTEHYMHTKGYTYIHTWVCLPLWVHTV